MRAKILTILPFIICTVSFQVLAQAPNWEWITTGGGDELGSISYGNACVNDPSGNTYLCGLHGDTMAVQKFNPSGNLIWTTKVVQKSTLCKMNDIAIDSNGNIYVAGVAYDTCYFGSAILAPEFFIGFGFVAKLDGNGNFLWAIKGNKFSRCEAITVDANNDILVGGYVGVNNDLEFAGLTVPTLTSGAHIFVAKINSSGTGIWGKVYKAGLSFNYGADCSVNDIVTDNAGNVLFTGTFDAGVSADFGGVTLSTSGPECYVAKTNSGGDLQWVRQSTSDLSYYDASGQGVGVDASGNVYLLGWIEENTNFGSLTATYSEVANMVLVKYNSDGTEQWLKAFGKVKNDNPNKRIVGFAVTGSGDIYLATSAGSFISGIDFGDGISFNFPISMNSVNYVVKLNNAGTTQWAKVNNSNMSDSFYNMSLDASGNVYVCGGWLGALGYDALTPPGGSTGIFLAKLGNNPLGFNDDIYSEGTDFTVYPNPANGQFTIRTENSARFELIDITGKLIDSFVIYNNETVIQYSVGSGVYFLRNVETSKVLKVIVK